MPAGTVQEQFARALDALVADLRQDRSILAAILCGSLSHDTVWERSDIDLVLVTVDDRQVPAGHASLYADGLNVHASLTPRTTFRRIVDGAAHNSFMHAFLAKGRLLYTHDDTIAAACERLHDIGQRDTERQLLAAAIGAIGPIDKARKWFVTRRDLDYSAVWILYAAESLARIEVVSRRLVADREVLPQAAALNPAFFDLVYRNLLNQPKTAAAIETALAAIEAYLGDRAPEIFKPVLEYLEAAGEIRSATDIDAHFTRTFDIAGLVAACEYLADRGLLGKASVPLRLTKRSTSAVQELAFFVPGGTPAGR
jgi:hypothetical protein